MLTTLTNQTIQLDIAPKLGRLLQLSYKGQRLFYTASQKDLLPADDVAIWTNHGGTRWEVGPQSAWKETPWARDWPPPPAFNMRKFSVNKISDHKAELVCNPDLEHTLTSQRVEIELSDDFLKITKHLKNLSNKPATWANWEIMQLLAVKGKSVITTPASDWNVMFTGDRDPSGFKGQFRVSDKTLVCTFGSVEGKAGVRVNEGWATFKPDRDKDLTMVILFSVDSNLRYPDDSPLQIYTSHNLPYVEIEPMGGLVRLDPKEERVDTTLWYMTEAKDPLSAAAEAREKQQR